MTERGLPPAAPPQDYAALKAQLSAQWPQLPRRLRQCARFVLDNPDAIALGTSASVARAAGVQPSTLVRFAQALGFSGFTEMQDLLKKNLLGRGRDGEERLRRLSPGALGSPGEILEGFASAAHDALTAMATETDTGALERAVGLIDEAHTVHLLGLRRSFPVAAYLFYAFGRIGKRCNLLDSVGGILADRTDLIGAGDVLAIITFHPYAPEVAEFAEVVAQAGRVVIAITDSPLSPARAMAREVLYVRDAEVGSFRALSATMCLAATLVAATDRAPGAAKGTGTAG